MGCEHNVVLVAGAGGFVEGVNPTDQSPAYVAGTPPASDSAAYVSASSPCGPTAVARGTGVARLGGIISVSPNPSLHDVRFEYRVTARSHVTLNICDINGRKVVQLVSASLNAGAYEAAWRPSKDHSGRYVSGVYFAQFVADGSAFVKRFVVVR